MTLKPIIGVLAAAICALPLTAWAGPYDALYVFGDNLSDRGNLAETGVLQRAAGVPVTNYPNPPSFHDSFTNGLVSVSLLANSFGLTADPSLWLTGFRDVNNLFGGGSYAPGTNYAVAGATSQLQAIGGPAGINLPQQLASYLSISPAADPNALYTVMIGGNDVRNAAIQDGGATNTPAGQTSVASAVTTEVSAVQALITAGARNFLVVNVPNVGVIPEFAEQAPAESPDATLYSNLYDSSLTISLAGLSDPGGKIAQFDLDSFSRSIIADAEPLGFTNTTDPCYIGATPISATTSAACGANAANIGQFIYWDSIHPTARQQALWAQGEEAVLAGNATPIPLPEPASLALIGTGILGLLAAKRRRRAG